MGTIAALETGVLYREDNRSALARLPEASVDLVYLDPPFFSNRVYEVIWGDEAEMRSFEDRWEGGIHHYVGWMRERARLLHRVLKPTGSLYLHCDPTASHYLKVMLDEVFGMERFRGEVTWVRTTTHNDAKRWSPNADTLLYYGKSASVTWNAAHGPHDPAYVADKYRNIEAGTGRRFQLDNITSPSARPNLTFSWRGHEPPRNGWRYSRETMQRLHEEGRIWYPDSKAKRPRLKRYLDEQRGPAIGNVWTDIAPLNSRARERLGYPTQKPESLLKRVIEASSNPGDVVLDPFCGCGTAISAAEQLGRRWIGMDISPTAVEIMKRRMRRVTDRTLTVVGMPDDESSLRQLAPFEFQNWVIQRFTGTHSPRKSGDMGIDGYSFMVGNPIQVKRSDKVGRNVVDNFETAMRRGGHDVGYIVAFSFTRTAREEAARARWHDGLEVRLITVKELLQPALEDRIPELASVTTLPMPPSRERAARPTAEELVASDLRHGSTGTA